MKKYSTIKRAVVTSYLSSMLIILITMYVLIIAIFFNLENRRIKSEINKTSISFYRIFEDAKDMSKEDTIKLIQQRMKSFSLIQGDDPSLYINLIYEGHSFTNQSRNEIYDCQTNLNKFQFKFFNKNILIIKNSVIILGDKKINFQIYTNYVAIANDFTALLKLLLFSSIFILIISVLIIKRINKIIQRPLQEITTTVQKINRHDLNGRISIINPNNELGKLSIVINEMIDRLDNSFKSQDLFVSNASHELRTPLAVIKGYADLLDAGAKSDPTMLDRGLFEILKEVKNMETLLKKLLFLARKENKALKNSIVPFEISTLIQELFEKQQFIDKDHNYKIIQNQISTINIDQDLILQALRELLKNSSKYTPINNEISISSFYKKNLHYIVIKDSGKGISKEHLKHVFERFYIENESRNRQTNSFGLGLSIVKDIIKLHNGNIEIESEVNIGTTITLIFPRVNK